MAAERAGRDHAPDLRRQPPRRATEGTYVRYDHEALVGILVLEATRAGVTVVGEDLGTVEPWVRDYLTERGILGTSVLWFERAGSGAAEVGMAHARELVEAARGRCEGVYVVAPYRRPTAVLELLRHALGAQHPAGVQPPPRAGVLLAGSGVHGKRQPSGVIGGWNSAQLVVAERTCLL